MADSFIGEIRIFGFNYAPYDWAYCTGTTLSVQQFTPLFALIGKTYGGDGKTTFNLPNLQGMVVAGVGATPDTALGKVVGTESVSINYDSMANHNHQAMAVARNGTALTATPSATSLPMGCANTSPPGYVSVKVFSDTTPPNTTLNSSAIGIGPVGGVAVALPHENRQPYLALNFCISLAGTFPSFD